LFFRKLFLLFVDVVEEWELTGGFSGNSSDPRSEEKRPMVRREKTRPATTRIKSLLGRRSKRKQ